jgi:hypothetical protein
MLPGKRANRLTSLWRRRESKPRFSLSAGSNWPQNQANAVTCSDESQHPSTVAGTFGSTEVRRSDPVIAALRGVLVAWEAGGDRAPLRRALLRLLSGLEDEPAR